MHACIAGVMCLFMSICMIASSDVLICTVYRERQRERERGRVGESVTDREIER